MANLCYNARLLGFPYADLLLDPSPWRRDPALHYLLMKTTALQEKAEMGEDGANLVVEVEGVERGRVPLHVLDGGVGFGRAGASPAVLAACGRRASQSVFGAERPVPGPGKLLF